MGRVSKHKKIKAMDPFYKGPRREPSREENLPPGSLTDDQPVPKSLLRIVRSSSGKSDKKMKRKQKPSETSHTKELGIDASEEQTFSRREGESLNDYLDRIDIESRARLVELSKKSKGTSERRKKYYEKRKKRLESKKGHKDDGVEFNDLQDTVRFGEVVTAPPKLSAKPRRKSDKAQVTLPSGKSDKPEQGPAVIVGLKRKQDIEEERERLIQRYRMAKKAKAERTKQQ